MDEKGEWSKRGVIAVKHVLEEDCSTDRSRPYPSVLPENTSLPTLYIRQSDPPESLPHATDASRKQSKGSVNMIQLQPPQA